MCGICGAAGITVSPSRLHAATRLMRHRGPDEEGFFRTDSVAFGMRRLKVIDLAGGTQPKTNEYETIQLVFNGEIYNYRELRDVLAAAGHTFGSDSDTEVIVHAYEEWGSQAFARLNGIFAIAIWDSRSNSVILARDHLGIKPLYYSVEGGKLAFGSELKPLLALLDDVPDIDPAAFALYLKYQYVPAPYSIVRGVKKLPAGQYLSFDLDMGTHTVQHYWNPLDFATNKQGVESFEAAEALVEHALKQAVNRQLVSDVPIGAFLSGGIDSSTVVALMAEVSNKTPKTFSIGFHEKHVDESGYARTVAEHLGTDHHELIVTADEARDVIPKLPQFFDEPFADSSAIPTYVVSGLAREHVTVSLSGDGGDELFGGYNRYSVLSRFRPLYAVPASARRAGVAFGRALPGRLGRQFRTHGQILTEGSVGRVYESMMSCVDPWTQSDIVDPQLIAGAVDSWPGEYFNTFQLLEAMMLTDLVTYLPDDILTKVDRASMAWSLESRVPLLDRELVELVLSLPVEYRANREPKGMLKGILRRRVPAAIVDRPKQGFSIPIHEWLRDDLYESLREHLSSTSLARHGLLRHAGVDRIVREHRSGWSDHGYLLWTLYMFQLWFDSFYAVTVSERARAS